MFAKTFAAMNSMGLPDLVGMAALPEQLSPQEEMQYASLWHAIVAFVLMAIILAHIYIGTVGMEGAYAAMGSGEVDETWAHQHHSLWLEDEKRKAAKPPATPAPDATPAE
jgi:formate dehydrogenase subunit gamma